MNSHSTWCISRTTSGPTRSTSRGGAHCECAASTTSATTCSASCARFCTTPTASTRASRRPGSRLRAGTKLRDEGLLMSIASEFLERVNDPNSDPHQFISLTFSGTRVYSAVMWTRGGLSWARSNTTRAARELLACLWVSSVLRLLTSHSKLKSQIMRINHCKLRIWHLLYAFKCLIIEKFVPLNYILCIKWFIQY